MSPFYFTILQQCQVDSDCGAERCCSVFETCHDKRGLDQSCNFVVSENYVIGQETDKYFKENTYNWYFL